jgi:hypothetical protein
MICAGASVLTRRRLAGREAFIFVSLAITNVLVTIGAGPPFHALTSIGVGAIHTLAAVLTRF